MSVSFDDAWSDSQFVETPPIIPKQIEQKVSAQKTMSLSERENEIIPQIKEKKEIDYSKYFETIIYEIINKNKEDKKRFTTYLIIAGVLLICILYYIEKLQTKVKELTTNIQRIQWINLHKNSNVPLSPLSEVFPWLQ